MTLGPTPFPERGMQDSQNHCKDGCVSLNKGEKPNKTVSILHSLLLRAVGFLHDDDHRARSADGDTSVYEQPYWQWHDSRRVAWRIIDVHRANDYTQYPGRQGNDMCCNVNLGAFLYCSCGSRAHFFAFCCFAIKFRGYLFPACLIIYNHDG
jgi:hypothetical protein